MRVIAGTYRSRLLVSPPGTATRPTSDRLRETLFNILTPRLPGCAFVDLFAGTGAVGIEALSRGARHVWFAENAAPALKSLRANLSALKIAHGFTVEDRGAMPLLQRLPKVSADSGPAGSGPAGLGPAGSGPAGSGPAGSGPAPSGIDIVYLDPPYDSEDSYTQTLGFLGGSSGAQFLRSNAVVIAEHATRPRFTLPEKSGVLTQYRRLKQGDASLTFYTTA